MQRLTRHDAIIFLAPALLVMLTITLYPFVYTLLLSFHDWNLATLAPSASSASRTTSRSSPTPTSGMRCG
jgi:ABC-type sugar transport system permease subunit